MNRFKLELFTEEFKEEVTRRIQAFAKTIERERFNFIYLCYYKDTKEYDVLYNTAYKPLDNCIYSIYNIIDKNNVTANYVANRLIKMLKDQLIINKVLPIDENVIQFLKELQRLSEKYGLVVTTDGVFLPTENDGITVEAIPDEIMRSAKGYCFTICNETVCDLMWLNENDFYKYGPKHGIYVKDYSDK